MTPQPKTEIKHKNTKYIVCPHCGLKGKSPWKYLTAAMGVNCGGCNKLYGYKKVGNIRWTSYKM